MTSFSLEKKQSAFQKMLPKMEVHYNGTGKNIHFMRARDPMRSVPSSVVSNYQAIHARCGGASAYFVYNPMVDLNKSRSSGQEAMGTTHFDVSSVKYAIRTLFVPFRSEPSYTEGMQQSDWYKDVKFVFVSEAHAIYMQRHLDWVPANVVVIFPICYRDTVENGYNFTEVESFGFFHSPQTEYIPYKNMDLSCCPLFFGTESDYNSLLEELKLTNEPQKNPDELHDQTKKRVRTNED